MAWQTKNGRRYYSRRWQRFGCLVREHYGSGIKGERAAAEDVARRAEEQARRQALRQEMQHWDATQLPLSQLTRASDFLTRTALVMSGLFKHGGEWRRNTHVHDNNDNEQVRADDSG